MVKKAVLDTPSSTVEDYLMEIYDMTRAGQKVIAARLTDKMGVSAPTVWNTVHRMKKRELVAIDDQSKEITLMPSGLAAAESIKRRHLLTERLLVEAEDLLLALVEGGLQLLAGEQLLLH